MSANHRLTTECNSYNKYWEMIENFTKDRCKSEKPKPILSNSDARLFLGFSERNWDRLNKDGEQAPFGFKNFKNGNWMFSIDSICRWLVEKGGMTQRYLQ